MFFQEIKSDKSLLPNLMQLTLSDHEASVRQMAAVLLRKDIARKVRQFLLQIITFSFPPFAKKSKMRFEITSFSRSQLKKTLVSGLL